MNKSNPFYKLNKRYPRIWVIVAFPVFILATLIVYPLEILANFIPSLFRELGNLFGNLRWDWKDCCKEPTYIINWCWKDWFSKITTGKGIKNEDKDEEDKDVLTEEN